MHTITHIHARAHEHACACTHTHARVRAEKGKIWATKFPAAISGFQIFVKNLASAGHHQGMGSAMGSGRGRGPLGQRQGQSLDEIQRMEIGEPLPWRPNGFGRTLTHPQLAPGGEVS